MSRGKNSSTIPLFSFFLMVSPPASPGFEAARATFEAPPRAFGAAALHHCHGPPERDEELRRGGAARGVASTSAVAQRLRVA